MCMGVSRSEPVCLLFMVHVSVVCVCDMCVMLHLEPFHEITRKWLSD